MAEKQEKPVEDPPDPDIVAVMHRVRDGAVPAHKRQFALDFHATLNLIGVGQGEAFYLVTGAMWEELKSQRDDARKERDELQHVVDNPDPGVDIEDVYAVLDDLKRGIIEVDELEDAMVRRIGSVDGS